MVCFKRLAQFVASEVRRQVDEEGFSYPEGDARIEFRCTASGRRVQGCEGRMPDYASVELLRRFDTTSVHTRSRACVEDGSSTLHNTSEHVFGHRPNDESKVAEVLEQSLDALHERSAELDYDPPEFSMRVETYVRRDGHLTVDVREIELPL